MDSLFGRNGLQGREKIFSKSLSESCGRSCGSSMPGSSTAYRGLRLCIGGSSCFTVNIIFPDDLIEIIQAAQHSGRYQQNDGSLAVIILRIVMVQHIGGVVKMQHCKSTEAFPERCRGPVQAAEKQQGQSGIHITLMHTDGEQEHRQDDKGTETEIS